MIPHLPDLMTQASALWVRISSLGELAAAFDDVEARGLSRAVDCLLRHGEKESAARSQSLIGLQRVVRQLLDDSMTAYSDIGLSIAHTAFGITVGQRLQDGVEREIEVEDIYFHCGQDGDEPTCRFQGRIIRKDGKPGRRGLIYLTVPGETK